MSNGSSGGSVLKISVNDMSLFSLIMNVIN